VVPTGAAGEQPCIQRAGQWHAQTEISLSARCHCTCCSLSVTRGDLTLQHEQLQVYCAETPIGEVQRARLSSTTAASRAEMDRERGDIICDRLEIEWQLRGTALAASETQTVGAAAMLRYIQQQPHCSRVFTAPAPMLLRVYCLTVNSGSGSSLQSDSR
jgi:hypothetical protein